MRVPSCAYERPRSATSSGPTEAIDWNCKPMEVRVTKISASATHRESMSARRRGRGIEREAKQPRRARGRAGRVPCEGGAHPLQLLAARLELAAVERVGPRLDQRSGARAHGPIRVVERLEEERGGVPLRCVREHRQDFASQRGFARRPTAVTDAPEIDSCPLA